MWLDACFKGLQVLYDAMNDVELVDEEGDVHPIPLKLSLTSLLAARGSVLGAWPIGPSEVAYYNNLPVACSYYYATPG